MTALPNFEKIVKDTNDGVVIFWAEGCGFSAAARQLKGKLNKKDIKVYTTKVGHIGDESRKTALANKIRPLLPRSKQQNITWPQVFYKGNYLGGYTDLVKKLG